MNLNNDAAAAESTHTHAHTRGRGLGNAGASAAFTEPRTFEMVSLGFFLGCSQKTNLSLLILTIRTQGDTSGTGTSKAPVSRPESLETTHTYC